MKMDKWKLHQGEDYTVILGPGDTTDSPIATIHREEYGPLIADVPELVEAYRELWAATENRTVDKNFFDFRARFRRIIAKT